MTAYLIQLNVDLGSMDRRDYEYPMLGVQKRPHSL